MRAGLLFTVAATTLLEAGWLHADDRASPPADRYQLRAHGETHAELFRRALLPGAYGAVVDNETVVPVYQYVLLQARDVDIQRRGVGLDLELSAWARALLDGANGEPPGAADVQTANVGYHRGPLSVRLGRQRVAGGAARYARFDGLLVGAELPQGFELEAYTGLTVLPRWNEHPGYTYLGAAADSQLKDPVQTSGTRERGDYWLAGGRASFSDRQYYAGLGFHEQHEHGGLSRRSLSVDGHAEFSPKFSAGTAATAELDAERVAEARLWLDAAIVPELDLWVDWLHSEPALFLSRQSVLSVFSADAYEEGGAQAALRAFGVLTFEGGAWLELYSGSRPGGRSELALRLFGDRLHRTFARVAYARVLTPDNGYHALRSSLTQRINPRLSGTIEAYAYFYDKAIHAYTSSSVYAGTLAYRPGRAFEVLLGASFVRSPYASLDAQTELRLAYDFDFSSLRGGR